MDWILHIINPPVVLLDLYYLELVICVDYKTALPLIIHVTSKLFDYLYSVW